MAQVAVIASTMRTLLISLSSVVLFAVACSGGATPTATPPVAATSSAAATAAGATSMAPKDRFGFVTINDVAKDIAQKSPVAIFDANSKERYAKGHIPGAKWVDSSKVDASVLPADHSEPLVFYCGSTQCMASHQAANQAADLGYTHVSVLPDGIKGWEAAGQPTEK